MNAIQFHRHCQSPPAKPQTCPRESGSEPRGPVSNRLRVCERPARSGPLSPRGTSGERAGERGCLFEFRKRTSSPPFRRGAGDTHAFTLIELLVSIAIIAILAAILLPVLTRAKSRADNINCISHLKQLGIAARLYAEDNNSILPFAELLPSNPTDPKNPLPRISDILARYVGKTVGTNATQSVLKCPRDNNWFFEVEGSSYQWNTLLNGQRIDLGENNRAKAVMVSNGVVVWQTNVNVTRGVEATPLLVDYDDFHPRPPKSGKNVVFMDGHAALFELPPIP